MIKQSLRTMGRFLITALALIGFISCCLLITARIPLPERTAPRMKGCIYDCRQLNGGAYWALWQRAQQPTYIPDVHIYQYPEDEATIISLISSTDQINFLVLPTNVTVHTMSGRAPEASSPTHFVSW